MPDKPSTQDTIKNFLSDIADSSNRAFNEFLDPPNKSKKSDLPEWFPSGHPLAALAGTPVGALQALAALGGTVNPVAVLAGANPLAALADTSHHTSASVNPLAALTGAANPLAALAGAVNPVAALGGASASANPLAAVGQLAGAAAALPASAGALGGLAESLATLPQQIARLSELLSTLVDALDTVQSVAATAGVRPSASAKKV
ncbi:hypothetical protein JCM4814A_52410 [Streptomyces phaeofaciens JCM 4814]|uniref:Uncharacterized protein n=1 Tax=Streptomyces phaeofaciens TaxID=68254 RepID=A0A918M0R0_9ACTN|nr:hypothetical protein [Streptomyces phaeofaciens]GGT93934.1 hypothetical protein GCM10010226_84670 [Streptomyces phaeofaciens]